MEKLHWLWPTLLYETEIDVGENIQTFNAKLIKSVVDVVQDGSGFLINSEDNRPVETYPAEVQIIRDAVLKSTDAWLRNAGLDHLFEITTMDSYAGIYKPDLFLSPHYHDPNVLITLYYLTDENDDGDQQVSAYLRPGQSRSTKAGHTVFMDPRGAISLRERPNIPGVMEPLTKPEIIEFCPKQGRMLTFPSHLLHWFMPTKSFRATITTGVDVKKRDGVLSDG